MERTTEAIALSLLYFMIGWVPRRGAWADWYGYLPFAPVLREAAAWAREAKLSAGTRPPCLRAVVDWMREASAGVIGVRGTEGRDCLVMIFHLSRKLPGLATWRTVGRRDSARRPRIR